QEAGLPVILDLGLALEAEARTRVVVGDDVSVAFPAVVPEHDGFVDMARDFELDLAVTLAGRGRLELGNALLKVGAAVPSEIPRLSRRRPDGEQPQCRE